MDNDDLPVGRVLSRREALRLLGAISAGALAACAPAQTSTQTAATTVPNTAVPATVAATAAPTSTAQATDAPASATAATVAVPTMTPASGVATLPSCVVRPALTEGPYFVDEMLNRSDVRSDPGTGAVSDGAKLLLAFRVSQISGADCVPLAGAQVDIWHCDAAGVYSDATDRSFNTKGQKFLRGYQVTDANGLVTFTTIYPGWYPGRAVHIHFKIRADAQATVTHEFTSQLFFDDAFSRQVYTQAPYAAKGQPTMTNADDGIFRGGGDQLLLDVKANDSGYAATFDIGLQTA
jgi:protocatechuate 3,4-dioxygenase beta subunit